MLGYLLREQQVQQSNKRDNEHSVFHRGETINGENPVTSLEIESTQKVKPQNSKMISRQQHSLSLTERASPLSLMCPNE